MSELAIKSYDKVIDDILNRQGVLRTGDLAKFTQVSRQAAHAYLRRLVSAGVLVAEGKGRGAHYRRAPPHFGDLRSNRALSALPLRTLSRSGLDESEVWTSLAGQIGRVPSNTFSLVQYGFTEMLNNAIDHSQSLMVNVSLGRIDDRLLFRIVDSGVGIFRHLMSARGLATEDDAIGELIKGKVTTQPDRHSGEGIFFTSKVADYFHIESGRWRWEVDNVREDEAIFTAFERQGTEIAFEVDANTQRTVEDVFKQYTNNDFEFSRTRIRLKLFDRAVRFMSRSEAKRLLSGLEKFREVILDFDHVEGVGQGFADEVFRVWARAHPEVALTPVGMGPAVHFMIERARR